MLFIWPRGRVVRSETSADVLYDLIVDAPDRAAAYAEALAHYGEDLTILPGDEPQTPVGRIALRACEILVADPGATTPTSRRNQKRARGRITERANPPPSR